MEPIGIAQSVYLLLFTFAQENGGDSLGAARIRLAIQYNPVCVSREKRTNVCSVAHLNCVFIICVRTDLLIIQYEALHGPL